VKKGYTYHAGLTGSVSLHRSSHKHHRTLTLVEIFLLDETTDCSLRGCPFKVIQGRWASWVVCYWASTTAIINVPWDQRPWMTLSGHYALCLEIQTNIWYMIVYACFHSRPQKN